MNSGERERRLPATVLNGFSPVDEAAVDALLVREIAGSPLRFVVLDDDPTGTQTVHGVSVYTDCSPQSIKSGLEEPGKLFYLLTNSRALTAEQTQRLHRRIGEDIQRVSRELGVQCVVMSRSDSTLRGHYPLETQTLRRALEADGQALDGEVLCPFFKEGGRFTIHGVHYVLDGGWLVPAAQTEFARDRTFGYTASYLPDYIEEKTGGAFRGQDVTVIPLEMLRSCDYGAIERKLEEVSGFGKICVDGVDYCDSKVFAVALYRAMAKGKRFLFRTAAALVKVMGGIADAPLLTRREMVASETGMGGVVVVGSYTQKTTEQLEALLGMDNVADIPFHSDAVLLGDGALCREVERCVALEERAIRSGKTAVCYTSRRQLELPGDTKESALQRSVQIGGAVQRLVGQLRVGPAFVVAKGGITSSTVATQALGIRKALVLGQACPGVPVWRAGPESRFPGIPYVVFPGNVGGRDTLRQVVGSLTGTAQ